MKTRLVEAGTEAQAFCHLPLARVAEHCAPPAQDHRHVLDAHAEALEQVLDVGRGLDVEVGVRLAVASQEFLELQRARRVPGPDENGIAQTARDTERPAQEKDAHQDVAELHVSDDDAPQTFAADFEDRPVLTDARGYERLPPSQHVELADELAATFRADQLLTEQGDAQDVGRALEHDVEVWARLPLLDENLTACDGKFARAGRDAGDLRFVELREELVLSLESSWRVEGEHHGEMDLGNDDAGRTPAEGR